jgi:hypothetical protein
LLIQAPYLDVGAGRAEKELAGMPVQPRVAASAEPSMSPWVRLTITAIADHGVAFRVGHRQYRASVIAPRHSCAEAPALAIDDTLHIAYRGANGDVLAAAPCRCHYLIYDIAPWIS